MTNLSTPEEIAKRLWDLIHFKTELEFPGDVATALRSIARDYDELVDEFDEVHELRQHFNLPSAGEADG